MPLRRDTVRGRFPSPTHGNARAVERGLLRTRTRTARLGIAPRARFAGIDSPYASRRRADDSGARDGALPGPWAESVPVHSRRGPPGPARAAHCVQDSDSFHCGTRLGPLSLQNRTRTASSTDLGPLPAPDPDRVQDCRRCWARPMDMMRDASSPPWLCRTFLARRAF